jgi:hypothetical protein
MAAIFSAWFAISGIAQAQLVTAPYGPGGTWNTYEFINTSRTWQDAQNDAVARGGHLLTVHSWGENDMAHFMSRGGDLWLGLTDREGAAPGAFEAGASRDTGWAWVTGEPLTFHDWGSGEPNDFNGAEDTAHIRGDGLWNDNAYAPDQGGTAFRYVVEYENNAADPIAGAVFAPNLYTAPFGPGGTWNLYEMVTGSKGYESSRDRAEGDGSVASQGNPGIAVFDRGLNTITGGAISHLHTVSGVDGGVSFNGQGGGGAMNEYLSTIIRNAGHNRAWLGFDDIAVEAGSNGLAWQWVDGSPVDYTNWGGGEPNDFNGAEDAAEIYLDGGNVWNDIGTEAQGGGGRPYVVEHDTESEFPIPGANRFPDLGPPPPPQLPAEFLPGNRNFEDCMWNIREVRDQGAPGDLRGAATILANGGGTIREGRFQYVDHRDPNTNGLAGVVNAPTGPDYPFITNDIHAAGEDDQDIAMVAHARMRVPVSGSWSFQFRSDDGAAMRLRRLDGTCPTWDAAYGAGAIDPSDPCTLAFPAPTGDSNTRGSITLAAGVYDVEFVAYENGGGAYWEVSHAQGVHPDHIGAYRLLGDKTPARHYYKPTMLVQDVDGNHFRQEVVDGNPGDIDHTVGAARAILNNPDGRPAFSGNVRLLNHKDNQNGVCCGGVDGDGIEPYVGIGADTVDDEDTAVRYTGILEMPADGWVRMHVQSDDGFGLTIDGAQFEIISDTGDGNGVVTNGGQTVEANYGTGNTNTVLDVFLAAGLHDFEYIGWDGCCGWYSQLYVVDTSGAMGRSILGASDVSMDFGVANTIALIPEPSSFLLTGLGLIGLVLGWWRRKKA